MAATVSAVVTPLDTLRRIETPEGITLSLRPAGPVVRALAWLIDSAIRYTLLLLGVIGFGFLGLTGIGLTLILFFLLEWFYPVVFEVYGSGATPGKRAFKLKVVFDTGTPVDFAGSLTRNLLRAADFLPFAYGFGLLSMLLTRDAKRLGDLAAGTLVIYRDNGRREYGDRGRALITAGPEQPPLALPPALALSISEQRLIIHFAERSDRLSPQRRDELASLLKPLFDSLPAPTPITLSARLIAHARWLLGQRA